MTRSAGTRIGIVIAALAAMVAALLPSGPAAAVGGCAISGASATGFVGQQQILSVVNCNDSTLVTATYPNGASQDVLIGTTSGPNGQAIWTPNQVGVANLSLNGTPWAGVLATSTIRQVPTQTTIAAPNTAQVGVPTLITVTVQSQSPSSYVPTGQVTVRDASGATVTTMGLTPSSGVNGQSFAYWRWTPPSTGTFTFQASYAGDSNALASTSPVDVVAATTSGNTISLTAPGTITQGVPALLTATVVPLNVQGSVGFTLNGAPISASVPLVNGVATFLWTPKVAGTVTLGANYMTNGGRSGSTTDTVTIAPGPTSPDAITLTQPGFGTWAPNGVYTRGNGTSFTFQAATLSGSPVMLSTKGAGPCSVTGLTLTVTAGSGQCSLIAQSAGSAGYQPVTQTYTVLAAPGQQTATLAAPPSGRFNKGRTIRLQNANQGVTNANQNITWRISNGGNRCRLRFPANGAVNVQLQRPGQCTVVARARAVKGQWKEFRLQRTYTAR
ncbi:MAG: hypothetical protein GC156_02640 [Actinomycetales bacterium]|nr:hypothetical protein [Actinomycetales bacterium]